MKPKIFFAIAALAGVALVAYLAVAPRFGHRAARSLTAAAPSSDASEPVSDPIDLPGPMAASGTTAPSLAAIIAALGDECRGTRDRNRVVGLSARLKKMVHGLPPDEAAAALAELLRSGSDYETGLGFVVGSEGVMDETPTLRTLLLDLLGQTDPETSAEVSREILAATDSADEYALALRNLAWINHDRRLDAELLGWLRRMLGRSQWMAQPSDGFLEAFDAAVDLGAAAEMAKVLSSTSGDPSLPADRAAFIALDRIVIADPQAILSPAARDASFLSASPMHRASLFSRLDVRDPRQQAALADYLLHFPHAAGELDYFSRVFPNGNRFVGNRLITPPEPLPSIAQIEALDRATLSLMETWAGDPAFVSRVGDLDAIANRLRTGRPTGR